MKITRFLLLGLLFGLVAKPAWAADAYLIKDGESGKSQAFFVVRDAGQGDCIEVKNPLLFLGCSVTWQSNSKTLLIRRGNHQALLLLQHPWVYLDQKQRLSLSEGFNIAEGRIVLSRTALEELLADLGFDKLSFKETSREEAQKALAQLEKEKVSKSISPVKSVVVEAAVQTASKTEKNSRASEEGDEDESNPVVHQEVEQPELANFLFNAKEVKTIVIDPGHGGYDSGAIGPHHSFEKDACLDIGLRLARLIRKKHPEIRVIMTRSTDVFIPLKERTEIANRANASLFISIHNNSSLDRHSHGTQVFFYDSQSSNKAAEILARRENANANYLEIMLTDLSKSVVRDQSIQLASQVESKITRTLGLKGRRLQYAPFYVLAKTKMPAVLVETAFISNPQEERLLDSSSFRQKVAQAIYEGLMGYRQKIQPQTASAEKN